MKLQKTVYTRLLNMFKRLFTPEPLETVGGQW